MENIVAIIYECIRFGLLQICSVSLTLKYSGFKIVIRKFGLKRSCHTERTLCISLTHSLWLSPCLCLLPSLLLSALRALH